jgi:serine/threonine protein kinase
VTDAGPDATLTEVLGASHSPTSQRPPAAPALARGTSVGRYLVLETVGAGGMGMVYAAFDPQLDRRVALKVLRSSHPAAAGTGTGSHDEEGRARLLREAQAMARLSHPNVLPVYDAAEHGGHVFIAMELVEGGATLRQWLEARPRTWREVVHVFAQAGGGLAAAHRAGLVHRDFKPENVLVGADGRVHVMDFGLARAGAEPERPAPDAPSPDAPAAGAPSRDTPARETPPVRVPAPGERGSGAGMLDESLTQAGAILGTPGYMAPEQYENGQVGPGADQFAFCAALYQGLYGQRAFAGPDTRQVMLASMTGRVRPPPPGTRVPGWLHRVVLRGLSPAREDRFPSMEALLAALQADPRARRRRQALAAAAGLLVVGAGSTGWFALGADGRASADCRAEAASAVATRWDAGRQAEVERAFLAVERPFARAAWQGVQGALGAYAGALEASHAEACLATRVRREASPRVLALREACLERRGAALGALADVLARADARVVENAVRATAELPPLAPCADVDWLVRQAEPPSAPDAVRALAEARARLARARALHASGQFAEAAAEAAPAVEAARAHAFAPLEAEALLQLGLAERRLNRNGPAAEHLEAAVWRGLEVREVEVPALAAAELLALLSPESAARAEEARRWDALGRAVLAHEPGGRPRALAALRSAYGVVLMVQDRLEEAEAVQREALALAERAYGAGAWETADFAGRLGATLRKRGKSAEALALTERALALTEGALGPEHPDLVRHLSRMAAMREALGEREAAAAVYARALALARRVLAPGHRSLSVVTHGYGELLRDMGRTGEARPLLEEALALDEARSGAESADVLLSMQGLVALHLKTGALGAARPLAERGLRIADARLPAGHTARLLSLLHLARLEAASGRQARALPLLSRLEAEAAASTGRPPPFLGEARLLHAQALLGTGGPRGEAARHLSAARAHLRAQKDAAGLAALEAWAAREGLAAPGAQAATGAP